MKTIYKQYGVTASITDKRDGTARLVVRDAFSQKVRLVSDVPVREVGEGQPHWLPLPSKEMNRLKYYLSYDHVGSHGPVQMQVIPYDPSNGVRVVGNNTFLYHGSLIVSGLFDTIKEALSDLGTYSKPTRLPDGSSVIPAVANGYEQDDSPFQRWHPGVQELWPGDPGWGLV